MLRAEDAAEDVLQEAFIQIWHDARNFDHRRASPMTWMAAITRHRALDRLRRKVPEVTLDEEHQATSAGHDEAQQAVLKLVRQQGPQHLSRHFVG